MGTAASTLQTGSLGKQKKLLITAQHQQLLCCSLFSRDIELSLAASDVGPVLVGTSSCGHSWYHPLRAWSPLSCPSHPGQWVPAGKHGNTDFGCLLHPVEGTVGSLWDGKRCSEHQDPLTGLYPSPRALAPHHELSLTFPHRLPCWRSCSCPQSVRRCQPR